MSRLLAALTRRKSAAALLVLGLIVVVLAILFVRVGTRHHADRSPAPQDILRSDLREMALAEELHAARLGTYTHPDSLPDFALSRGVTVLDASAEAAGWEATLRHDPSGTTCSLRVAPDSAMEPECREGSR